MTRLRVLFADDEQMARKRVRRLLELMDGIEIVAECESGEEALRELDRVDVDLAILDVRMGIVSGLEVADAAAELGVEIVFTTAHAEHALSAFELGALDYVQKPIEGERLAAAVARVRQRVDATRRASPTEAPREHLAIESRGEIRLLRTANISHAISDGRLVSVWAEGGEILTDRTLGDLEATLCPPTFIRVHRRALLNPDHLERLRPVGTGGYVASTRTGQAVPVSRQAARALRRRLGIG